MLLFISEANEICSVKIKQMKTLHRISKNVNRQLLKYYVSKNKSFETSNFEEKEIIVMQAQSKIYNLEFYLYALLSISAVTLFLRTLILNAV
jgi:hypothetical protein